MCLSVYLGTTLPIEPFSNVADGGINIEPAAWKPPTLSGFKFVYYVGQVNQTPKLGCSCAFVEYVEWQAGLPKVVSDDSYKEDLKCAFSVLRKLCEVALNLGASCSLVTDDSGGLEQACNKNDYHNLFLKTHMIERHNLIFASNVPYPYRHFTVLN